MSFIARLVQWTKKYLYLVYFIKSKFDFKYFWHKSDMDDSLVHTW